MKTVLTVSLGRIALYSLLLAGILPAQAAGEGDSPGAPQMLDVSKFIREVFVSGGNTNPTFQNIIGTQSFDGLPFRIEGRGWVYGLKEAERNNASPNAYPDFIGIVVGRKFEELHLLHASRWQEADGRDIAHIRAHYEDGTTNDWPIIYGAHVRDWQRLHSEETESLTDINSKIVWKGEPRTKAMSSAVRLFKTKFINPFPEKTVVTLDVISSRRMAAYDLVAATVANRDQKRAVTKSLVASPRKFGRAITVRVIDAVSSNTIAGALIDPGMVVDGGSVIASPQLTATNGEAAIRYPGLHVTDLFLQVEKDGYRSQSMVWSSKKVGPAIWQRAIEYFYLIEGFVPDAVTISLQPTNLPPPPVIFRPGAGGRGSP